MKVQSVAIIGGGPAGSTLAAFLARAGVKVALFDQGKRPELAVGESLVPALVPILQHLGIEEEVRAYSTYKPGATFYLKSNQNEATFFFDRDTSSYPSYAYNVPREKFDDTLRKKAAADGAKFFQVRADPEITGADQIGICEEAIQATGGFLPAKPDLVVDAAGRARLVSKLLDIPCRVGKRKDSALFAHMDQTECPHEGNIHIDVFDQGWCWRIPIPGRMSVGIVAPSDYLHGFGDDISSQFDNVLQSSPQLKSSVGCGKRISKVFKFTNYQALSERFVGSNWALVGDSSGFVDPIFSSGLLIAMRGAEQLADVVLRGGVKSLKQYERLARRHLNSWQHIVDHYYDGRLMSLVMEGQEFRKTLVGRAVSGHIERHVSRVISGNGINHAYSTRLLDALLKYGLQNRDPEALRIH